VNVVKTDPLRLFIGNTPTRYDRMSAGCHASAVAGKHIRWLDAASSDLGAIPGARFRAQLAARTR